MNPTDLCIYYKISAIFQVQKKEGKNKPHYIIIITFALVRVIPYVSFVFLFVKIRKIIHLVKAHKYNFFLLLYLWHQKQNRNMV